MAWAEAMLRRWPLWLIVHGLLWTTLPLIFHANLQRDQIEGYAWGQAWAWGYAKHPPLWAWALEATTTLTGRPTAWAAYALGAWSGVAAMVFIHALARRLLTPLGAVLAVLVLEGVLYLNFRTVDFNANVVLLPFWAAAGFFLHRVVKDDRWGDWLALAASLALAIYGKYVSLILIAVIAIWWLTEPSLRRRLFGVKPWAALAFALMVLAPHVWWLAGADFAPFTYAVARTETAQGTPNLLGHIKEPILFALKQVPEILGLIVLATNLAWLRGSRATLDLAGQPDALERRMVFSLAFGPLAMTVVICAVMGRPFVAAWGLPMFGFLGLAAVMWIGATSPAALTRFARIWLAVVMLIALAFPLYYSMLPAWRGKPSKTQFPGQALAVAVESAWRAKAGERALPVIAGPIYVAGNAAFHLAQGSSLGRPQVLIDGDTRISPWIDPARLETQGLVLVWLDEGRGPPAFLGRFPQAQVQDSIDLAFEHGRGLAPVRIGMAVVPPTAQP